MTNLSYHRCLTKNLVHESVNKHYSLDSLEILGFRTFNCLVTLLTNSEKYDTLSPLTILCTNCDGMYTEKGITGYWPLVKY